MGRLRATMIGVRVTAAERVLLEGAAEADGLPLATLLRREALRAARRARRLREWDPQLGSLSA